MSSHVHSEQPGCGSPSHGSHGSSSHTPLDTAPLSRPSSRRRRRRFPWLDALGFGPRRREEMVQWRVKGLSCLAAVGLVFVLLGGRLPGMASSEGDSSYTVSSGASRRLLSIVNSSTENHGPEWEQCHFEKAHIPGAWVFNHAVCILIVFIALAIVCDDFFVPSLEAISEKLNLSEDVAGATFMAAGSSAPELFTSVVGVVARTDVGVGTIVGSAVFNLLIIIALTGALAGQVLFLDWRPLVRDSFFYSMSICCFIGFAWDGIFQHYEAAILLSLYIIYIVLMVFNPRVMEWMGMWRCFCCAAPAVSPQDHDSEKESSPDLANTDSIHHSNPKLQDGEGVRRSSNLPRKSVAHGPHTEDIIKEAEEDSETGAANGGMNGDLKRDPSVEKEMKDGSQAEGQESEGEEEEEQRTINICPCLPCCPAIRTWPPDSEEARAKGGFMAWFKLIVRWVLFVPAFPFVCLFSWTVPDCSKEHNKKYFLLSFFISVGWIMTLSFGMVTLVGRAGCILGVDTYIMGLVIIAIGTSIPDALSSILVARDGFGDMAVSNAIGSNVFDINLGIGLPFIIRIAIDKGIPIELLDDVEWANYHSGMMPIIPHAKFGFILLLILFIALVIFVLAKFRLSKWIGATFVFIYVLFLAYAFTQELYCFRQLDLYC